MTFWTGSGFGIRIHNPGFEECVSGLADFKDVCGLAISWLENFENYRISV
jgi:hypothetical protein